MEGDPHIRARQRERQRALAQQRNLEHVPEATVVITNPTHLAVALRYNEKEDQAPVLVAKGAAKIAERIREIAVQNNIPVIQDPPVARMLFENVEPGEEIPEDLYRAVAGSWHWYTDCRKKNASSVRRLEFSPSRQALAKYGSKQYNISKYYIFFIGNGCFFLWPYVRF